ncbi:uncharacterized protein DS421_14g460440 [Arachis hypogaea]|nr:uncharacterized protein DS421_14g460440 [Arachis hypogaea]
MMQPSRCIYNIQRQQNMPMHERIIPYLERASFYHLAMLNSHWFWLVEPMISAFIERWRPETHFSLTVRRVHHHVARCGLSDKVVRRWGGC